MRCNRIKTCIFPDLADTTDPSKGDAFIGFQQLLTGAISRNVHDKLSEMVSVKDFGARGDNSNDDGNAIQSAFEATNEGGSIIFPPGEYRTSRPLSLRGKIDLTIIALGRARIRAIGKELAGKPILDLVGCTRTRVYNLRTHSTPTGNNRPACAVAIGRESDDSAPQLGGSMLFEGCIFSGKHSLSTLYQCGSELTTFSQCSLTNTDPAPAYYDSSKDLYGITGPGTEHVSNVRRYFYGCRISAYLGDVGGTIAHLAGGQQEVVFKNCYFAFHKGRGRAIVVQDKHGTTRRLYLEDIRLETGTKTSDQWLNQHDTCLLYIDKPNALEELYAYGLYMPAKGTENPLTLIDVARGGITKSDIVILNKHNATYAIRLQKGAVLERNRIVVPSANSILVENGAMAQQNIVQHFDRVAEGSAFTGTGTIQHNLEHQPL